MVHRIKDKLNLLAFIKPGVAELYQRAAVAVIGYELLKDIPSSEFGDAAAQELDALREREEQVQMRKEGDRIEREKEAYELLHCPDGSLHEFGEELTEQYDMGYKDDDEMKARQYGLRTYRLCLKCGYWKSGD